VTFISDSKYDRLRGEYKGLYEVTHINTLEFVIYSLNKAGQSALNFLAYFTLTNMCAFYKFSTV